MQDLSIRVGSTSRNGQVEEKTAYHFRGICDIWGCLSSAGMNSVILVGPGKRQEEIMED